MKATKNFMNKPITWGDSFKWSGTFLGLYAAVIGACVAYEKYTNYKAEKEMLQHLAPSRARSLALTKLDEVLLWANVGISEAGLQQDYTAVPRNRGFDFDDALKSGLVTVDLQKLTEIVEAAAQKEATHGKDGAPRHLAELELLARAQKDWYYAMLSYIMGGDSDAKEESKWNRETL